MTGLVTGVAGLRLAAEAVLDLWRRAGVTPGADRAAARRELLAGADALTGWYEDFAAAPVGATAASPSRSSTTRPPSADWRRQSAPT